MQKKSSVKRNTRTTTRKNVTTEVKMPQVHVHECQCGNACSCGCHCGRFKKFIVLLIVFILGFAVAKITCCRGRHHMPKIQPVFDNGCLVMDSIKCPKMQQELIFADTDMNGCITQEEFSSVKRSMHEKMRAHRDHDDD